MRYLIDLCEGLEDVPKTGKFWYYCKTGQVWSFNGTHHVVRALNNPEIVDIIKAQNPEFDESIVEKVNDAFKGFMGDGRSSDEPYLAYHDRFVTVLLKMGFIRGFTKTSKGREFDIEFAPRFERKARELCETFGAVSVRVEINGTEEAGTLSDFRLERWLNGMPFKSVWKEQ